MSKYGMLLNILDHIREEARSTPFTARYIAATTDPEQINHERARAFIHLYLKVCFGLLDFAQTEHFVTDGTYDGGVDGYYIDTEKKLVYFIQSKFRTTESNFVTKQMTRIVEGHIESEKVRLIEAISEATNLQTTVITADRYSNESVNLHLQKVLFDEYGFLYERKRGEFEDGLHNGYIERKQIIERNLFFRILVAANGDLNRAVQKRLFTKLSKSSWALPDTKELNRFYFAFHCFQLLNPRQTAAEYQTKEIYAKLYVMTSWYMPNDPKGFELAVAEEQNPVH